MEKIQPADGAFDNAHFSVHWVDGHREPTQPPDPNYPNGSAIDVALDAPTACCITLPCPAARCGLWVVRCLLCGYSVALTTAGRPDDPSSLRVPCKLV